MAGPALLRQDAVGERLASGSSGAPGVPSAAKVGWRPLRCCSPAWCECRFSRQAAGARLLAGTAGDILPGSQERTLTLGTFPPCVSYALALLSFCALSVSVLISRVASARG